MVTYFFIGFLAAIFAGLTWMRSPRRLRFAARVFVAIADTIEGKRTERKPVETIRQAPTPAVSNVEAEVASAIVNLSGAKPTTADRKAAAEYAHYAANELPGATFDDVFRRASAIARKKAA